METINAAIHVFKVVTEFGRGEHKNLQLIAFLRFWGEVLTAIEYEALWPRIKLLLRNQASVFYAYHMAHDKRACTLAAVLANQHSSTHADQLGRALVRLIPSEGKAREAAIRAVIVATKQARQNKDMFYAQFNDVSVSPTGSNEVEQKLIEEKRAGEVRATKLASLQSKFDQEHARAERLQAVSDEREKIIETLKTELRQVRQ